MPAGLPALVTTSSNTPSRPRCTSCASTPVAVAFVTSTVIASISRRNSPTPSGAHVSRRPSASSTRLASYAAPSCAGVAPSSVASVAAAA
ncbi:hypothetical protein EDF46_2196 [Frondihabitans sp. PhB188]|uniref:hypothetical protein n=1 Tax=Frondihabitans sp. PhB188 TaxID=2485200 RepID=UPI000FC05343|nr:hypothetical protein [Frondihabitans sp. PhB188]ROQ38557.1 hypothetical protein EDF46_2196 [Frondihabitans sp. PhB188]